MASAKEPPSFTEAQWAAVDRWCFSYKKSTDIFVRWVCRYSGLPLEMQSNSSGSLISLAAISGGVKKIVAQRIPPPLHIRRALGKTIELRTQVTSLYQAVETVETTATKGHVAFTKQLVTFQEALETISPHSKNLKGENPFITTKGAYGPLRSNESSDSGENLDDSVTVAKEAATTKAKNKVNTPLLSLVDDQLLEDMMVRSGALILIFVITTANTAFNIKILNPRALCEAAWVATAATYLVRGLCYNLLAETGLGIEELLNRIQKLLLDHDAKALELLSLDKIVPGILRMLAEACKAQIETTTKLSPEQAGIFEADLRSQDLHTDKMLIISKHLLSNVRAWCFAMANQASLYDWVPHVPLARVVMGHIYNARESNMFHAAMETILVLETSAVCIQASDKPVFCNTAETTSGFLKMIVDFLGKRPWSIQSLLDKEMKEDLNNIRHLCKEHSTDEATIATSHPWAAGSLMLTILAKLYDTSLPLLHWNKVISIVIHLYHACIRYETCAEIPIMETITVLLADVVFAGGLPSKGSFKSSLDAYTAKEKEKGHTSSKAKGSAKKKKLAIYATHPSVIMLFWNPQPDDSENNLMKCVKELNGDNKVPPISDWTPLTTITQLRAAAQREFREELPRAMINILAIFDLCMEFLDGANEVWRIEWGTGDAWLRATLGKIEKLLQEVDGSGSNPTGTTSSHLSALGKSFRRFEAKFSSEVFWDLK